MSTSASFLPPASSVWMSWWDTYCAPGDLRRRQQHTKPPTAPAVSTTDNGAPNSIAPTTHREHVAGLTRITASHRARRQNALFFGGLTFSLLSFAVTRRTILRKRIAAYPSTFTPSHMHIEPPPGPQQQMTRVEGSLMAIEALGLATLNVCAVFMAGIGGVMMWFDVAELEDLRGRVRVEDLGGGEVDVEAEKEVEGWIAGAFGQQQSGGVGAEGLRQGVLGKLEEMKNEQSTKEGKGEEV